MNNAEHKKTLDKAKSQHEDSDDLQTIIRVLKEKVAPGQLKKLVKDDEFTAVLNKRGLNL